ncbi:MAG: TnsA endonuclease N-terminal domain-containing protein [Cellvibrionaceae bacterium]|uniref:TnsA endonuclease N-terminal domain-containing protein n=1 Tax=Dasania phycosphaerae TaxID=2950436 RepID=A0A9J6RJL4_9GAMM|nr:MULTISPECIES: TnsA endonuclease N-terminal domain-containing protein [Dasania]MCR8921963.1 TnsA endonuclease N-terminal domain-containing protein [Dasania sp. GY-MA-18]MCZ0864391.1 TnsA endonuclease N-terminal domain-containing protein [Dasania phycosphaerae]MCZ0868119.1 TnsA endonuclease N-terminal domain-containing protein [Dasania phycosphaerae]
MGRKNYWNSEAKNRRWIKSGRGQGAGSDYKPWLTVRDVASKGRSHRVFGHLTQRTHHLLSDLELATFLLLQWRPTTIDIREQFPLDREVTLQLSKDLGIEHPNHHGLDQYMSSDFVVDAREKVNSRFVIQVKATESLNDSRTIEKLEIERRYWSEKQIPWFLVTENQMPSTVFENINLLYNHIDDETELGELMIQFELFRKHLPRSESLRVKDLCIKLDLAYDYEPGESLYQIKRLLAQRYFHFDITKPFTELRCSDLTAESFEVLQEVWRVSG